MLRRRTLSGYTDVLSAAAGERVRFMVSAQEGDVYHADLVRLRGGDLHPLGSGFSEQMVAAAFAGDHAGRPQRIHAGSFAWAPAEGRPAPTASFSCCLHFWATTPAAGRQVLLALGGPAAGFSLLLDAGGEPRLELAGDGRCVVVASAQVVREREWTFIAASVDAESGEVLLLQQARGARLQSVHARADVAAVAPAGAPLMLAAQWNGEWRESCTAGGGTRRVPVARAFYNGKLERPRVAQGAHPAAWLRALSTHRPPPACTPSLLAAFDFSRGIPGIDIEDVSPHRCHGRIENLPTRAMTGVDWNGSEQCWRHAPRHYAAIHFHDDDVHDAGWQPDFEYEVPADLASGLYAARLRRNDRAGADETEYLPFVVRPPQGKARARAALLLPTASYMAYANEHAALYAPGTETLSGHLPALKAEDVFLQAHPEYGCSLYDTHSDGSGVAHSSRLRPILNLRPGYTNPWIGEGGSAPWQFNADLHIVSWLHSAGFEVDCITDEDLHAEGLSLLSSYAVVLTGTHPEYHSTAMLDAIEAYIGRGGRLIYLGGNGFYWRIAFHRDEAGVIELRRAEDGIRDWVAEPGEYYHAFSGEYGGLWRRLGRPPQRLVGVGMAVQGFDRCGWFVRTQEGRDPRVAFVFEGVTGDIIGDYGVVGGGAAGLELDRHDEALGSPPGCVVLARSDGLTPLYYPGPEEVDNVSSDLSALQNPRARGDMVFFDNAAGGAVFSASSIAWAGSLGWNGYDNDVARITGNVLRRFLDPSPFGR